jgi:hypothetical protein
MTFIPTFARRPAFTIVMLAAAIASSSALAAPKPSKVELAQMLAVYQQERAVCMSGKSNQERSVCLREASAAYAQAKRGDLTNNAPAYQANASQRCDALPANDKLDCQARMQGQGTVSGSAQSGGISRELTTQQTVAPTGQDSSVKP